MSIGFDVLAFLVALVATLGASEVLVWGLGRLGLKLGLTAGLLGLVTALGADAPEIASASSAVFSGARDIGVGVILGSNLFNLAALLGLSGIVAGRLPLPRLAPLADGSANLVVTLVAALALLGLVPGRLAAVLFAAVLAVYAALLSLPPRRMRALRLPAGVGRVLVDLSAQIHAEDLVADFLRAGRSWWPVSLVPAALAVIVVGSVVMVTTAIALGRAWRTPDVLVGTVVLAGITSLPNLYAALRLALRGDGATVLSEAFNSNTLNLVAGIGLPAVVLGTGAASAAAGGTLVWLATLSVGAITIASLQRSLTRVGGAAIVLFYAAFVVALLRTAGTWR